MNFENSINNKIDNRPKIVDQDLVEVINKVYSKNIFLRDEHIKAIASEDVAALRELAKRISSKLDYDMKYQGTDEDRKLYEQENGYSWVELNSAYSKLLSRIESEK